MANPEYYPLPTWSPYFERPRNIFKGTELITIIGKANPGTLSKLAAYPLKPELSDGEYFSLWLGKFDEVLFPTMVERNAMLFDIGMPVSYNGVTGRHCFLEYLDVGFGTSAGRELWGWPKKFGKLNWTQRDGRFHIEVQKDGYTLAMIDFQEGGDLHAASWPSIPGLGDEDTYLQVRPHGQPDADGALALDVIAKDPEDAVIFRSANSGEATIRFFDGPTDPLSFLGPLEIVAARIDRYDFEFGWPKVIGTERIADPSAYAAERMALANRLRTEAGFEPKANPMRL